MQFIEAGIVPNRVSDPAAAFAELRARGSVILTDAGSSRDDARAIAANVLATLNPVIPDPAPIKEGGGNADRSYDNMPGAEPVFRVPFQTGHTDGFSYGDRLPDFIFLLCLRPAASGGESLSIDTYRILDALAASSDSDDVALHTFLTTETIEQTEPDMRASLSPVVVMTPSGRRQVRWTPVQRPNPALGDADRARQQTLLDRWKMLAHQASLHAPKFTLQAGEAICIDNYRMLHGRTGFDDLERALWRIWAWSPEAVGVPEGMLFSDSRFAVAR